MKAKKTNQLKIDFEKKSLEIALEKALQTFDYLCEQLEKMGFTQAYRQKWLTRKDIEKRKNENDNLLSYSLQKGSIKVSFGSKFDFEKHEYIHTQISATVWQYSETRERIFKTRLEEKIEKYRQKNILHQVEINGLDHVDFFIKTYLPNPIPPLQP